MGLIIKDEVILTRIINDMVILSHLETRSKVNPEVYLDLFSDARIKAATLSKVRMSRVLCC